MKVDFKVLQTVETWVAIVSKSLKCKHRVVCGRGVFRGGHLEEIEDSTVINFQSEGEAVVHFIEKCTKENKKLFVWKDDRTHNVPTSQAGLLALIIEYV